MQDHEAAESKLSKVVTGILVGVVVAVVSLVLEYKTNFFTRTFAGESPAPHEAPAVNSHTQNQNITTAPKESHSGNGRVDERPDPKRVGKIEPSVDSGGEEIGSQPLPSVTEKATSENSVHEPELRQALKKPFVRQQTANDFEFILERCGPDGDNLRCRVLVTSALKPKRIMISDRSRLKVGMQSIEPSKLIKDTGQDYNTAIHFNVPAGEQIEFSLVFPGQKNVKEATLLEVKCAGFSVTWDNPPIG